MSIAYWTMGGCGTELFGQALNTMLPLEGVRVLDLSDESAVFTTRILADLGADVILVEPPGGSPVRRLAPFLHDDPDAEHSFYHLYHNANKRSVTADIERAAGVALVRDLAANADVFVETFAPGHLVKLGLGYDELRAVNRRLIYVSVTPFGQRGEWRDRRTCDLVAAAAAGLLYVSGEPEDPPVQGGADPAFKMASLAAATGVTMALAGRDLDPDAEGAHLDVSLQEAANMAALQTANPTTYTWSKRIPRRPGLSVAYLCADGKWAGLNIRPDRFTELLGWFDEAGIEHSFTPDDWPQVGAGINPSRELRTRVRQLAAGANRDDFVKRAQELNMLSLPTLHLSEMEHVEHFRVNGQFLDIDHEPFGVRLGFVRSPVDAIVTDAAIRRAPKLGEHNTEVYSSIGRTAVELERLAAEGIT